MVEVILDSRDISHMLEYVDGLKVKVVLFGKQGKRWLDVCCNDPLCSGVVTNIDREMYALLVHKGVLVFIKATRDGDRIGDVEVREYLGEDLDVIWGALPD